MTLHQSVNYAPVLELSLYSSEIQGIITVKQACELYRNIMLYLVGVDNHCL